MKKKQLPLLKFCVEQLASGINIALLSYVLLLYSYPVFFFVFVQHFEPCVIVNYFIK
jgi:hypothetical protein